MLIVLTMTVIVRWNPPEGICRTAGLACICTPSCVRTRACEMLDARNACILNVKKQQGGGGVGWKVEGGSKS
jgi:hypothetical protein